MRKLVMSAIAALLVILLFVPSTVDRAVGPLELFLWLILWVIWGVTLVKWAIPRDRAFAS